MIRTHAEYELDDSLQRIDFERVCGWLATTYWWQDFPWERIEKAAHGSALVVGAYRDNVQAGYLRVVSDQATFAWVCDVFVEEAHRGQGLAKAMVRFALEHPDYQGLRRWVLATRDAHGVYAEVGFMPLPSPERWMIYLPSKAPPKGTP